MDKTEAQQPEQYLNTKLQPLISRLSDWLSIPSVSTQEKRKKEVDRAATWTMDYLNEIGLDKVSVIPTDMHPIVYAEHCKADNAPTLLIYGHYDVQPEDPIELWDSPAFHPTIKDGQIIARGASDNKGQIFCHLAALDYYLNEIGQLPINVKILIEGEEEIGSPSLSPFIKNNKALLSSDIALVSDTPMFAKDQPSLCLGLKGLVYAELRVKVMAGDVHSGQKGGAAPNAIHELIAILSQLKNEDDKVLIPGFYDSVLPLEPEIQDKLKALPFDKQEYMSQLGTKKLIGEAEYSVFERLWFRPTLDINGIIGGYTEQGAKTVIPAQASAKLSMRLVANQDPVQVQNQLKTYLNSISPEHIELNIEFFNTANPVRSNHKHPAFQNALLALEKAFHRKPVIQGEGGSIPVIAELKEQLGIDSILMGLNLPEDKIHAPNEQMSLENIRRGILASIYFLDEMSKD